MPTTKETRIFSSRGFTRDVSAAKRQASDGPVFITDRGRAAFVLLSVGEYTRLTQGEKNIVEQLAMPENLVAEFEPPKANIGLQIPELD